MSRMLEVQCLVHHVQITSYLHVEVKRKVAAHHQVSFLLNCTAFVLVYFKHKKSFLVVFIVSR